MLNMLTTKEKAELKKRLLAATNVLVTSGQLELKRQGHRATGKLIDTMEAVVLSETSEDFRSGIEIEDYGLQVDTGTKPGDVPSPFKDVSEFSRFIQKMRVWSRQVLPGLDQSERSDFLLATNRRHRIEGIPTRASKRFSSVGRRTGWIQHGFEDPTAQDNAFKKFDLFIFVELLYNRAVDESTTSPQ